MWPSYIRLCIDMWIDCEDMWIENNLQCLENLFKYGQKRKRIPLNIFLINQGNVKTFNCGWKENGKLSTDFSYQWRQSILKCP